MKKSIFLAAVALMASAQPVFADPTWQIRSDGGAYTVFRLNNPAQGIFDRDIYVTTRDSGMELWRDKDGDLKVFSHWMRRIYGHRS